MAGCGGSDGSGVSSGKTLVSLSEDEVTDLCEYLVDVVSPTRTIDCGGGTTVTVGAGTQAECEADMDALAVENPSCRATVGNAESCIEGLADLSDAQLCSEDTPLPAGCLEFFLCALGGG